MLSVLEDFDYSFSENGLVAYHKGELVGRTVRDQYSCKPATALTMMLLIGWHICLSV